MVVNYWTFRIMMTFGLIVIGVTASLLSANMRGERQRLAIARALLQEAPILILDEPSANLDPLTERQVLATWFEGRRGKTSLFITHRLIGLEHVDEILVMDRGQIVERGAQADLLARGGLYRHLWDLQNQIVTEAGR